MYAIRSYYVIVVNTVKLESISTAGSAGFILIFSLVNYTAFRCARLINGNKVIALTGFILGIAFV